MTVVTDPAGRLPARTARQWAFDVAVVLLVMATIVLRADDPELTRQTAVIETVLALPLVLRRVCPSAVFTTLLFAFGTLPLWSDVTGPNLSLLVALYTVAAHQSRIRASLAALALVVVFVLAVTSTQDVTLIDAVVFGTALTAAALGLGLWIGTRRSLLAELRDRAERLERELDQQHELAVQTERARMTREMHDVVAHHLTVVVALSDAAARTAQKSPAEAAEVMRTVSATGRQALSETRRVLNGTNQGSPRERNDPHDLEPIPGLDGVDTLLDRVRAAGLPVSYVVSGAPGAAGDTTSIESGVQLTVFRLIQEALTNTLKHAGPGARANVRLQYGAERITLTIEDDGGGRRARPAPERGGGRGLTGMRERVSTYGGQVESGPRSPSGWRVCARLETISG